MNSIIVHVPDLLCFYRVIASILALGLGHHPAAPWLYSSALISDLFDGWFFRRYVKNNPAWHPWCKLPISSIDPPCDFVMMVAGTTYAARYAFELGIIASIGAAALTASFSLGLNFIPNLWPRRSELLWTICITTVTHGSLLIMLAVVVFAWYANSSHWLLSASITIVLFYLIFALIGNRQRFIRHPPANWRQ